jgi:hypothetical protein
MNQKGYGRKRSWPNGSITPALAWRDKKNTRNLRIVSVPAEI